MLFDLGKERVISEIKDLVKSVEDSKEDFDIYCELVREMFLNTSCQN